MTSASTAPESKRMVNAETVAAAAVAVAQRGALINVTSVRQQIGSGSNETVAKYLKLWAGQNMPLLAGKSLLPTWTARELEGMEAFRRVMRLEAAASFDGERAAMEEKVTEAGAEVEAAKTETAQAQRERAQALERLAGLETGMAALRQNLEAGNRERLSLLAQNEAQQAAAAETARQYEITNTDLRQQMAHAVERFAGMEKHLLLETDRARTETTSIREKLEGELAHATAIRARDVAEIERLRRLREETTDRLTTLEAELTQERATRADVERRLATAEGQADANATKLGELITTVTTLSSSHEAVLHRAMAAEAALQALAPIAGSLVELAEALSRPEAKPAPDALVALGVAAAAVRARLAGAG